MKKKQCKKKGNRLENLTYHLLKKYGFHKNLGSGSSTLDIPGDLSNELFIIECKHYKKITDGNIKKWWNKLTSQVVKYNHEKILNNTLNTSTNSDVSSTNLVFISKIPVLLFKGNNRKPIVMINHFIRNKEVPIMMSLDIFITTYLDKQTKE